jgi:hypothetical protein
VIFVQSSTRGCAFLHLNHQKKSCSKPQTIWTFWTKDNDKKYTNHKIFRLWNTKPQDKTQKHKKFAQICKKHKTRVNKMCYSYDIVTGYPDVTVALYGFIGASDRGT